MIGSYLTTPDLARLLTISASRVKQMRYSGEGPRFIKIGQRVCYDPTDVKAWVQSMKQRRKRKDKRNKTKLEGVDL